MRIGATRAGKGSARRHAGAGIASRTIASAPTDSRAICERRGRGGHLGRSSGLPSITRTRSPNPGGRRNRPRRRSRVERPVFSVGHGGRSTVRAVPAPGHAVGRGGMFFPLGAAAPRVGSNSQVYFGLFPRVSLLRERCAWIVSGREGRNRDFARAAKGGARFFFYSSRRVSP